MPNREVRMLTVCLNDNFRSGHEMMALAFTLRASKLTSAEVVEFAQHIQAANTQPGKSTYQFSILYYSSVKCF